MKCIYFQNLCVLLTWLANHTKNGTNPFQSSSTGLWNIQEKRDCFTEIWSALKLHSVLYQSWWSSPWEIMNWQLVEPWIESFTRFEACFRTLDSRSMIAYAGEPFFNSIDVWTWQTSYYACKRWHLNIFSCFVSRFCCNAAVMMIGWLMVYIFCNYH